MVAIVPEASIIILKFHTNNKNSSVLLLSNKDILNSYKSDFSDVGSLHNLIFTQILRFLVIITLYEWNWGHLHMHF